MGTTERTVVVIDGHPDPDPKRLVHGLAGAYIESAQQAGHSIELVRLADLDIPLLRSERDWQSGDVPADVAQAQEKIRAADHLVFVFPLWLGSMPALLKAFLEQVMRPGFAFDEEAREGGGQRLLAGKSARIVVTMGMPALFFRWFYRAHGVRFFKRNILKFCGISPVRSVYFGLAGSGSPGRRDKAMQKMRRWGREAR